MAYPQISLVRFRKAWLKGVELTGASKMPEWKEPSWYRLYSIYELGVTLGLEWKDVSRAIMLVLGAQGRCEKYLYAEDYDGPEHLYQKDLMDGKVSLEKTLEFYIYALAGECPDEYIL